MIKLIQTVIIKTENPDSIHVLAVKSKGVFFLHLFSYSIELSPPTTCDRYEQGISHSLASGKGVVIMVNTSDYEKTIEHQFDSFCKTVLKNQARNIYAENKRRNARFISLESLTPAELSKLCVYDTYETECIWFLVDNYEIPIADILIAQAIESLSKRQRDIILLSFFLSMSDVDIAELMSLAKSTVHYHKENALNKLRKFMEEITDEE